MAGLRERKRARTHAQIQQEAIRLFRQQGYANTRVDQICEAAEVSPSTFFRYFPTKEDVLLDDRLDEQVVEAFRAQPPELTPIQAVREAFRTVFTALPREVKTWETERQAVIRSVPELQARMLQTFTDSIRMLAAAVAERVGRSPDELEVRTFAGALIGVSLSAMMYADENVDYVTLMDAGLGQLERGLTL
ncbi:TetR family transcriptional regulator [Micromonospora sp. NPDC023888]|uniref:acyl-CoA-like ligand-binding transcription factor n=1 Tax=Micromonospora sp. NPDC023888 TaxID=3155607 RepID=UPI00340AD21E